MVLLKLFALCLLVGLFIFFVSLFIKKRRYEKTEYFLQTKTPYFTVWFNKGRLGEFYTYRYLETLPGQKRYLFNLYMPKNGEDTTEIDVILLHESGIYVFESKNYSGWIFGTETQPYWTQTLSNGKGPAHKTRFFNPIMQNKVHLKWLQNFLADDTLPFYSYIVFSDRCTLKSITLTSGEHTVVNRYDLLSAVRQNAAKAGALLSPEKIETLYTLLYPFTQTDAEKKATHVEKIQQKYPEPSAQPKPAKSKQTSEEKTMPEPEYADAKKDAPPPAPANPPEASGEKSTVPAALSENGTAEGEICPRCGGNLVLRTASKGKHCGKQFLGCSNFPKCRYTKNIPGE